VLAALILFSAAFPIAARDLSREQSAVEYARQEYQRAETEHKADAEQAARTRNALDSLSKQLAEEQKKAGLSAKKMQQAKAQLSKAKEALDRAWKQK